MICVTQDAVGGEGCGALEEMFGEGHQFLTVAVIFLLKEKHRVVSIASKVRGVTLQA